MTTTTPRFHLTMASRNIKTDAIPVTTSGRHTCPPSCIFIGICYASEFPLSLHWKKVTDGRSGVEWSEFTRSIAIMPTGTFWRHNQAGDLPGNGDTIDTVALLQLVEANRGKRGFSYTHKPVEGHSPLATSNRAGVRYANDHGFVVSLSGNNLAHADQLMKLNVGPVVSVVPLDHPKHSSTPAGHKVVVCPAQTVEGMTCDKCRLCSLSTRKFIIAFRPHGGKKRAIAAASEAYIPEVTE